MSHIEIFHNDLLYLYILRSDRVERLWSATFHIVCTYLSEAHPHPWGHSQDQKQSNRDSCGFVNDALVLTSSSIVFKCNTRPPGSQKPW